MTPEYARNTEEILRRVQGGILEMPGLRLTQTQACRMWGLQRAACNALLGAVGGCKFFFSHPPNGRFLPVLYRPVPVMDPIGWGHPHQKKNPGRGYRAQLFPPLVEDPPLPGLKRNFFPGEPTSAMG